MLVQAGSMFNVEDPIEALIIVVLLPSSMSSFLILENSGVHQSAMKDIAGSKIVSTFIPTNGMADDSKS